MPGPFAVLGGRWKSVWWELEDAIAMAAKRRIRKFEAYRKRVYDDNQRSDRRTLRPLVPREVKRPPLWADPGYDPYHVYYRRRQIAHAIRKALRDGAYKPRPPAPVPIRKKDGSIRTVAAYTIADEVISQRLYRSLLIKNRGLLSARAYAYRDDIGIYDALRHVSQDWESSHRLFVAEYDFTDYFGSLRHDYLWDVMQRLGVSITALERRVLAGFLSTSPSLSSTADRGIAQGTSVSLFLANVAATPLDRQLEQLGVGFVRYADDTLMWSTDYGTVTAAVERLHEAARAMGVDLNHQKSPGVRLLVSRDTTKAELRFTHRVDFLSHALELRGTRMGEDNLSGIKNQVSELIYRHLLKEPQLGTQNLGRLGVQDNDYTAYVWQLRRLLYGHLTERDVLRLTHQTMPPIRFSGMLAAFPLVDPESMRELDRWIVTRTWLALRKRESLLSPLIGGCPHPWGLPRAALYDYKFISSRTGDVVDARLPRAERMMRVLRRAAATHGTKVVGWGAAASLY